MPKRKYSDAGFRPTPKTNPANKKYKTGYQISKNPMYATVPRTKGIYAKGETKYYDTYYSNTAPGGGVIGPGTSITSSHTWTNCMADPVQGGLCNPAQGPAIGQRIGREIYLTKLKVRGWVQMPNVSATLVNGINQSLVRLILVQDQQTNAVQMTSDLLQRAYNNVVPPGAAVATDYEALASYQSLDNFGRFKVLKDKMLAMSQNSLVYYSPTAGGGDLVLGAGQIKTFKMNVNFKEPVKIRFNSTAIEGITGVVDNSFHIIANGSLANPPVNLYYSCRACYRDPG